MNPKKLGFGLMRLPLVNPADMTKVNYATLCQMVDRYMEEGFNYFDTANPYHGGGNSEIAFRECIAKRYPRNSYTITNKLSFFIVQKAEQLEDFFAGQLERCGVDYFDYYLLHSMNKDYLELAEKIGAFDFVQKKKAEGKIKHIGFSFHDTADVLEDFLTRHPEMEYVQLQLNYADWENVEVQSRKNYETAVKYGKQILVMEPVKGGILASVPPEAEKLLKVAEPDMSVASWAIRYVASLPNVAMVLSGMSNVEQMEDNLSYMSDFKPLTEKEKQLVEQVAQIIISKERIACTGCRYCTDGCPQKIGIPDYFKLMNDISKFGDRQVQVSQNYYNHYTVTLGMGKASACIQCGQCESHCPQHLPIIQYLKETAEMLE
ncbi:aldo/keto reductase [Clostridiaceae bacterium NSJ-31]|uniref:Aldo/keto reductase n=1 Tax=Ligaoa zhengdingensis TaxID=2763658 RepID=A0A926I4Y7_9FIRM|nr:aldo/keto reductase [Ligaoa zhengdingensis]MBC8546711.1 aldo/keto reductase [Ligaoa zhengdingensis]